MFKKRIGPDIHQGVDGPNNSSGAKGCPDLWELDDGNIAVIGLRKTSLLAKQLPPGAGCGPDEEIVILPRSLLQNAKSDILKL